MADEQRAYAALAPCGCWRILITHDSPKSELTKFFADAVRADLNIERMTKAQIKACPDRCKVCKPDGECEAFDFAEEETC